ncbi:hypothetical protein, partial [Thiolapillus sp.]
MTRTAGARIGCQRPSRFWGLGCPKIYHEVEDTLATWSSRWAPQQVRIVLAFSVCRLVSHRCRNILSVLSHHHTPH